MSTIGDLKKFCKDHKIKFTATKDKGLNKFIKKITITKTRAIKIVMNYGRITHAFWDDNRKAYAASSENNWSYYNLKDETNIGGWYNTILELLETEAAKKTAPTKFPVPKNEFSADIVTRYTNGLVKANISLTQAFVSGVVKVTNRGIIKEMQVDDECDCWFLVDGRCKCPTSCDGKPLRIIYDGEKHYSTIEKTDKSCRIAENQVILSNIDKMIVESAMTLFLTLKEKEKGG